MGENDIDIHALIKHSLNMTCALDPIPIELIKQHAGDLVPVIISVVNALLLLGCFPTKLKLAQVTSLLKKEGLDQNILKKVRASV